MTGCIVGWAHTPFGRLDTETVESLIVRVATDALADAGIAAKQMKANDHDHQDHGGCNGARDPWRTNKGRNCEHREEHNCQTGQCASPQSLRNGP